VTGIETVIEAGLDLQVNSAVYPGLFAVMAKKAVWGESKP